MPKITNQSIKQAIQPTWCPGCGDFMILAALQQAVIDLEIPEENLVITYGIGCSGNMADFNRVYGFHSLHGRAIPAAVGIKLANHKLKVLAIGGDGDMYGEGLNHLIGSARGNHDVTVIVHNNRRYSLTTGQSSPTSKKGTVTKSTPQGLIENELNPLVLALTVHASFVARGYSGNLKQLTAIFKQAITHQGFSFVDVLQVCPTFNKENTPKWYEQNTYDLIEANHDIHNKEQALKRANETDKLATGIFYQDKNSIPYHAQVPQLKEKTLIETWEEQRDISQSVQAFI